MSDTRERELLAWATNEVAQQWPSACPAQRLEVVSGDASFRRYLRVQARHGSLIVMDAPPPLEDVRPFVHIARLIAAAGLRAPQVFDVDELQGFVLLAALPRLVLGA